MPWSQLVVQPDGCASFCCDVPNPLTVDGRLGTLGRDSLDDLWNSEDLVQTRAAMVAGERPASCQVCWDREASGSLSRRQLTTEIYRLGGGELELEMLPLIGAETGYRLERRPDWFLLELGNVCNLRCRSCDPIFSSRIAGDAIHSAWAATPVPPELATLTALRPEPGAPISSAWFRNIDATADMVAGGATGNAMLSLLGGEPFLARETWQLLEALVERGVAGNIMVGFSTNGQQRSARLAELAPHFRSMHVSVSVDGYGRLYEYLRHGGSWDKLMENLVWLHTLPGVSPLITPTLQNANALDMVALLRFLEQWNLHLNFNVVTWPARLAPSNLPPAVRRRAAARLREFLVTECSAKNANVVRGYCEILEAAPDEFDASLFEEFMTFTNDLDASRGESLAEAAPELAARIADAGIPWSPARRHGLAQTTT